LLVTSSRVRLHEKGGSRMKWPCTTRYNALDLAQLRRYRSSSALADNALRLHGHARVAGTLPMGHRWTNWPSNNRTTRGALSR
jgi:hypothetical protein